MSPDRPEINSQMAAGTGTGAVVHVPSLSETLLYTPTGLLSMTDFTYCLLLFCKSHYQANIFVIIQF